MVQYSGTPVLPLLLAWVGRSRHSDVVDPENVAICPLPVNWAGQTQRPSFVPLFPTLIK